MNPYPILRTMAFGAALIGTQTHAQTYSNTVLVDEPLAYYGLGDPLPVDTAINQGSLGATLNGIHTRVVHRVAGALVGRDNPATFFDGAGTAGPSYTLIPNNPALNPDATQPFTIETWIRPTVEENIASGQAPLSNRKSNGDRQGWVFFQRASTAVPGRQQGWNFRMYSGSGSGTSIDITGGTYTIGTWCHLVVVWDGSTATMYVDGTAVATSSPGTYAPNTTTPFGIGAYSDPAGSNPFTGDIDEVAFYPLALDSSQISDHYNKGLTNIPGTSYQQQVATDGATMLHRMDEYDACRTVALNSGTIAPQGNGAHFPGATLSVPGALANETDTAIRYDGIEKTSNDANYATTIPFDPRLNTESFSWEGWVRPTTEGKANAQCVYMNYTTSGNRIGWVLWQRGSSALSSGDRGWNLRIYNADGGNRLIDITTGNSNSEGNYTINEWQHLVITYDQGTKTAVFYINGNEVARQTGTGNAYVPNTGQVTPAIGGFANGRENPFYGDMDEIAFYDYPLDPSRVAAHYFNGTGQSPFVSYSDEVAADIPVAYYRMNESNRAPATNLGSLGTTATGTYVNSPAPTSGPNAPAFKGFPSGKTGTTFRGNSTYVELNNPAELNFSGPMTLEAWVQPAAAQANFANCIIGHGGNANFSGEIYLRIENGRYEVGTSSGKASAAVPASDLGTGKWVHLAGTWNAGTWTLYRNGTVIATGSDATGPTPIANANWAIGARGRWMETTPTFPTPPTNVDHRVFSGGISDAAIYNKALSQERVLAHFLAGVGPSPLTITRPNGVTTLEWSNGILQASDNLGSWVDLPAAISPYTPVDGPSHFYRLRFD